MHFTKAVSVYICSGMLVNRGILRFLPGDGPILHATGKLNACIVTNEYNRRREAESNEADFNQARKCVESILANGAGRPDASRNVGTGPLPAWRAHSRSAASRRAKGFPHPAAPRSRAFGSRGLSRGSSPAWICGSKIFDRRHL